MKYFIILFFISTPLFANEQIWSTNEWHSLLRYQKTFFGHKSDIINSNYFLSKEGRHSPEKEFKKTVITFNTDTNGKLQCLYPARSIILNRHNLIKTPFSLEKCSEYIKLKRKLNLSNISMIFSSYYINSPASAFGHTFLKLRSHDSAKDNNDLLDYGLDFSAQVTTKNPIMYGIKGITGGFEGRFKLMPYYYKVREYSNLESRDLWEFSLNYNQEELDYFVAQLVELNSAKFNYYYLTQNCSYHILALLNATRPNLLLMQSLALIVPPVDTLYAITKDKSFIKKTIFRPSVYKSMSTRIKSFNSNETLLFKKLIKNNRDYKKILASTLDSSEKLNILQAYSNYIDYKDAKKQYGVKDKNYKRLIKEKMEFNLYRSRIEGKTKENNYTLDYKSSPLLGHKTRNIRFSLESDLKKIENPSLVIDYRVALHNYLQIKKGYIPYSTTEMGKLSFKIDQDRLRLRKAELINVEALRPLSMIGYKMSWRFSTGVANDSFISSQNFNPYLNISLGTALSFNNFLVSTFIRTENRLASKYIFNLGPNILFIYNNNRLSGSLDLSYLRVFNQQYLYDKKLKLESLLHFNKNFRIIFSFQYQKQIKVQNIFKIGLGMSY